MFVGKWCDFKVLLYDFGSAESVKSGNEARGRREFGSRSVRSFLVVVLSVSLYINLFQKQTK